MSAFLASQRTYDYIAGALYEAATSTDALIHYNIRYFLGVERSEDLGKIEEAILSAVRSLYNLNRIALVTRYSEPYDRSDKFVPEIKKTPRFNPLQLIACIRCVLYQCSEYLTDETDTYKCWSRLAGDLAMSYVSQLPEYNKTKWDL